LTIGLTFSGPQSIDGSRRWVCPGCGRGGQRAPDFTLPQLGGDPMSLSDALSQCDVVLLYFFYAAT